MDSGTVWKFVNHLEMQVKKLNNKQTSHLFIYLMWKTIKFYENI